MLLLGERFPQLKLSLMFLGLGSSWGDCASRFPSRDVCVLVLYQSGVGALKLLLSGDSADQSLTALPVPHTEPDSRPVQGGSVFGLSQRSDRRQFLAVGGCFLQNRSEICVSPELASASSC
jgi:hypothetical protein